MSLFFPPFAGCKRLRAFADSSLPSKVERFFASGIDQFHILEAGGAVGRDCASKMAACLWKTAAEAARCWNEPVVVSTNTAQKPF